MREQKDIKDRKKTASGEYRIQEEQNSSGIDRETLGGARVHALCTLDQPHLDLWIKHLKFVFLNVKVAYVDMID